MTTTTTEDFASLGKPAPQPRTVRFDPEKLYLAVDQRRRELRLTRREVLRQVGERTPSSLTRLGQGAHPSADLLVRLMAWLGEHDVRNYTSPAEEN